jgi:hypothetical protein
METQNKDNRTLVFRILGWIIALAISCAVIFGSTFMLGPTLFAIPGLSDRITVMVYCPDAVTTSVSDGASTQTTTSPSGVYGHTVEITCTMADGSEKVIRNEQVAISSIGGMFGLGAICGLCLAVPIMLAPLFLFRKRKEK